MSLFQQSAIEWRQPLLYKTTCARTLTYLHQGDNAWFSSCTVKKYQLNSPMKLRARQIRIISPNRLTLSFFQNCRCNWMFLFVVTITYVLIVHIYFVELLNIFQNCFLGKLLHKTTLNLDKTFIFVIRWDDKYSLFSC